MGSLSISSIRRVAIVGSGPGGVVAAKYLRAERHFDKIDIFEQQASFGGVWNFTPTDRDTTVSIPQTSPNAPAERPIWRHEDNDFPTFVNPMYERLETNIPHSLMQYSDSPSFQDNQLFPTRESTVDYLTEHAKDVKGLVYFQTQIIDIQLKQSTKQDTWIVETKNLVSDKISRQEYDAVVVANGHYCVPYLPDIKGIREWDKANPGVIAHSKLYRNPAPYTNKKVLVVGNSASGVDIAAQIAAVAKQPIINSARSDNPLSFSAPWKRNAPEIVEFLSPSSKVRAVRFKDGSIEADVDAILFCTGYYYSYPFLSSLSPKLIDTGERVQHLYRHLFFIEHPTLVFMGLPAKIIPFRTFEGQAAVIARVWTHRLDLPTKDQMKQWEKSEIAERGTGKSFHVLSFPKDVEYHNTMVDWAQEASKSENGKIPPRWSAKETWQRKKLALIKKAFGERGDDRHFVKSIDELGFDYDEAPKGEKHE